VYSVTPASAGVGDTVTIAGDNLGTLYAPPTITFNGVPSPYVSCASDSSCTVRVPNGSGYADVRALAYGLTSAQASKPLFAYRAPIITSMSPVAGALTGGTLVHLLGGGFDPNMVGGTGSDGLMSVYFGNVPSPNVFCVSNTECFAQSPASQALGAVPVTFSAYGVGSAAAGAPSFTYAANALLSGLTINQKTSQGSVSIDSFAPAGGAVVSLTSANPTTVTVPASVTIPAGASSVTFVVSGTGWTYGGGYVAVTANYLASTTTASVAVMNTPPPNTTTCGGVKRPTTGCVLPNSWHCCGTSWICGSAGVSCQ
jgi:hypothetical protein